MSHMLEAFIGLIVLVAFFFRRRSSQSTGAIPGPPGLPVIGNLHQLKGRPWLLFTEWKKQYGDVFYINIAGQDTVILSSHTAAADLLDKRSVIYSGRGKNIVTRLLTGGMVFAFAQHDALWKRMRRGAHEALNNSIAKNYFAFQETESVFLVDQLLKDPVDWDNHLRRASTSLVVSIVYGLPPLLSSKDPNIVRANGFVERAVHAALPGSFLVEYFTWLQYLPRWMSPWRKYAEEWFKKDQVFFEKMFKDAQTRMAQGTQKDCVITELIANESKLGMPAHEPAWLAATLFAAGSDTVSGQLAWFLQAMILYPDVQKRAQQEIDRVVGRDRLPTFNDFEQLVYVRALVKEIMRWRGVGPLAIPHRLSRDDWYRGYHFKKDTIFIVNVWALNLDPEVYGNDVDEFVPERHLDAEGKMRHVAPDSKDESHYSYGFGRRICVGRHVANNSMFIEIAYLLWSFSIGAGKDENGNPVYPDPMEFIDEGLVVRPKPFTCSIVPRSPEVNGMIARMKEAQI